MAWAFPTRARCAWWRRTIRYTATVETAAIVTRMAPSFVRFGSFEHWSARRDLDRLATLADYVIDRYYPECRETRAATGGPERVRYQPAARSDAARRC